LKEPLGRRVLCEAIGAAFLLATVVGSGIAGLKLAAGNVALALVANSLAAGAILVVLIAIFGPVSGAHFNPAVTSAAAVVGGIERRDVPAYLVGQVVGAVAGVWVAHLMFEHPVWQIAATQRAGPAQWLSEGVATFGLLLTIFGCAALRPPLRSRWASTSRPPTGSRPRPRSPIRR
jgi:glycerol uptake facilitator-like aquaporin